MQLFISSVNIRQGLHIRILEDRIIFQCTKVLRYNVGDRFYLQDANRRYELVIISMTKQFLETEILQEMNIYHTTTTLAMLVALPNKREKAELIVQKLAEIWVDRIFFRPAKKSQLRDMPEKKKQRLEIIALEASEQSRSQKVPEIKFIVDLRSSLATEYHMIVFDIWNKKNTELSNLDLSILWVIGPEWWLDEYDYNQFARWFSCYSLGKQVLRMETAAIVWSWYLKNYLLLK